MSVREAIAYQATDLARKHREVIDAARHGGALIRDKDGTALVMAPAEVVDRADAIAQLALDLVRAAQAIMDDQHERTPGAYGGLGWLSVLPVDSQRRFFEEMSDALMVAASGTSLRPVELLLGDWRATAEAWADPDTRKRLLAPEEAPLHDVGL